MSTSTGRYQSQILNFLNRHGQQLKDRAAATARHLKLALLWGTQIGLYPIYAVFQATRMVGRQLSQAAARSALQSNPHRATTPSSGSTAGFTPEVATDLAIQQVLNGLRDLDLPDRPASLQLVGSGDPTAIMAQSPIQGIACLIATQQLVLTTVASEILDILTLPQQRRLQNQMVIALASFGRVQKQQARQLAQRSVGELEHLVPRPQQLPIVRRFLRLMAWVQGGTIAHSLNLFQETQLLPEAVDAWPGWPSLSGFPELPRLSGFPSPSTLPNRLEGRFETDLAPGFQGGPLSVGTSRLDQPATDRSVGDLIRSAIQFFFGSKAPRQLPAQTARISGATAPNLQADPWDGPPLDLMASGPTPKVLQPSLRNKRLPPALQPRLINIADRAALQPSRRQRSVAPPEGLVAVRYPIDQSANPDWIEVEGSPIGYHKHPLERVLGWLDTGLSSLEQQLGQLWRRIQHWLSIGSR
jgi:hypothetical protein